MDIKAFNSNRFESSFFAIYQGMVGVFGKTLTEILRISITS